MTVRRPVPIGFPKLVTVAPHEVGSSHERIGNTSPSNSQIVPDVFSGSRLIAWKRVFSGDARVPSFVSLPVEDDTY
ncbi:hypothetical protein D3C80_1712200 [compost metagenome]